VDKILSGFENLTGLERTSTLSTDYQFFKKPFNGDIERLLL
jgi:hypothetical protein